MTTTEIGAAVDLLFGVPDFGQAVQAVTAADLAVETGVWAAVAERELTPAEVAEQAGLTEIGATLLLHVMHALGLVTRGRQGGYRAVIDPAAYASVRARREALLGRLQGVAVPGQDDAAYVQVAPGLARRFGDWPELVLEQVAPRPGARLLDVGAGVSPAGRLLLRRDPAARVVALDRADVLGVLRQMAQADGVADRLELRPADARTAAWPGGNDVVLLAGILHLFPEPDIRRLLRRAAGAVTPGGHVVVVSQLWDEEPRPAVATALYALDLHVRKPIGGIWPYSQLAAWLAEVGLGSVRRVRAEGPGWIVLARADE